MYSGLSFSLRLHRQRPQLALTAAVVVGDDVVLPVAGVVAGAHPGDRRGFGARRTGVRRAAAAAAQEPVDRAVAPVVAALRVAGVRPAGPSRAGAPRATGSSGSAAAPNSSAPRLPMSRRRDTRRAMSRASASTRRSTACMPADFPCCRSWRHHDRGRLAEAVDRAQIAARQGVVDIEHVALDEAGEQQRMRVLRHRDRAGLVARRSAAPASASPDRRPIRPFPGPCGSPGSPCA